MPGYIKLCLDTWKFDFTILNYDNLKSYTQFDIERTKRFTMPQIADCVRVHVLRDNGGVWLDADTIMIGELPTENIAGDPKERTNTIGYLRTEQNSDMFTEWAAYQDEVIASHLCYANWDVFGNKFTDRYLKEHDEITICPIEVFWAETYMINGKMPRQDKYRKFYFESSYHISDIKETAMLMLHNSWTPDAYKRISADEVLRRNCTLSNILREVLL